MPRGRDETQWSPRRARRAAAAWVAVVVSASVVDPAAVVAVLDGAASATGSAVGGAFGVDGYTLAHVVAYGVLAWLLVDGIDEERAESGRTTVRTAILVVAVATAVGGAVELLQTGVAARSGSVADAAVNGIGALAGSVARGTLRGDRGSESRS